MNTSLDPMKRTEGAVHDEQNIKGFFGPYRFLSNYEVCPVEYDGVLYPSSEAAYQAAKTLDLAERVQFQNCKPSEAKKLGYGVKLRTDWNDVKDDVMYEVVRDKFVNNGSLCSKLLATGDKYLEETNWWKDTYWGVCCGDGWNTLGQILMKVRFELSQK